MDQHNKSSRPTQLRSRHSTGTDCNHSRFRSCQSSPLIRLTFSRHCQPPLSPCQIDWHPRPVAAWPILRLHGMRIKVCSNPTRASPPPFQPTPICPHAIFETRLYSRNPDTQNTQHPPSTLGVLPPSSTPVSHVFASNPSQTNFMHAYPIHTPPTTTLCIAPPGCRTTPNVKVVKYSQHQERHPCFVSRTSSAQYVLS